VYVGPVAGGAPPGQINIAFPDPSPVASRSCTFEVRRNHDLAQTPRWYQRVNGQTPPIDARIGAYFWGGFEPAQNQLGDAAWNGIGRLRDAGIVGPVRLAMGPKQRGNPSMGNPPSYNVYNIDFSPCPVGTSPGTPQNVPAPFLPCAVNLPAFQRAFDRVPATTKIIITAMDSTSAGDNETELRRFVNKTWMETPANYALVRSEYQAMAENLLLSRHGKANGKTFVIANWEGDNLLYCGGVYAVMKHGDFQGCPGGANEDFAFNKDGLVAWMRARRDGIALAKAAHPMITDVAVDDGVEFAVFGLVKECGGNTPCPVRPDVLHDVLPAVQPRYALYSAWESVGNGRIDEDLRAIATFLAPYGTTNIVGEWGFPGFDNNNGVLPLHTWLLKETTKAVLRSSFDSATTWHGFPVVDQMDHLLAHDGDEMIVGMTALRAGALPPPVTSPRIQIVALDEASRANDRRYFELWGSFATGHDYVPKVKCNGDTVFDGAQEYRSAAQVNISIPESHADQWCVFYLVDATDPAVRSNDIGPYHTCWGQPCPRYL
jgi:hypothetical protein